MKYIYYIIAIMILITGLTAFQLTDLKVEVSDPALIINDRVMSDRELDTIARSWSKSYHMADLLDIIITNQLMIQEAVKLGLNKEETFRQSIERYYEQSLVKVLIDRKFQSFSPQISESLVEKYNLYSQSMVEFTREDYDSLETAEKGVSPNSKTHIKPFEDMSEELQYILLSLEPGDRSKPSESDPGYVVYHLRSISPLENSSQATDRAMIIEFLTHQKKQAMFNQWITELKADADIKILTDRKF